VRGEVAGGMEILVPSSAQQAVKQARQAGGTRYSITSPVGMYLPQ
jgi:hypothetical protein